MSRCMLALTTGAFAYGDDALLLIISAPASLIAFPSCGMKRDIDVYSALDVFGRTRRHLVSRRQRSGGQEVSRSVRLSAL